MTTTTKKKATKKKAARRTSPSKADVARARGKEPEKAPSVGRTKNNKTQAKRIVIRPPSWAAETVYLVGTQPLITHAWSSKALKMMLENEMAGGLSKKQRRELSGRKDPFEEYHSSICWFDGLASIASISVKSCMISSIRYVPDVNAPSLKQAVFVEGTHIPLYGTPRARMDNVMVGPFGNRSATTRFRAQFDEWALEVPIRWLEQIINYDDLINLLAFSGHTSGLCERRPEKGDVFGTFRVVDKGEGQEIIERLSRVSEDDVTRENSGIGDLMDQVKILWEMEGEQE